MKASVSTKYGEPEVIQILDIKKPVPKKGKVLIRVQTSSVNRTDCAFLSGKPLIMRFVAGLWKPRRTILGSEFAGEVVELGSNVEKLKVGDRVFGFNDEIASGHGEYMAYPVDKMISVIPDNVDFKTAGVASEGAFYALTGIKKMNIKKGHKVFVNGGTGAIGSATIQILVSMGVEVDTTCSTDNIELVKSLGASKIIDYTKTDFTKCGKTYDCVIDSVGKSSYHKCKKIMKKGAVFTASELGPRFSNVYLSIWTAIFGGVGGHKIVFPIPKNDQSIMDTITKLLATSKYKPVIDRTYTLDQTAEAFTYVSSGRKIGNVSIKVIDEHSNKL